MDSHAEGVILFLIFSLTFWVDLRLVLAYFHMSLTQNLPLLTSREQFLGSEILAGNKIQ